MNTALLSPCGQYRLRLDLGAVALGWSSRTAKRILSWRKCNGRDKHE